MAMLYLAHDLGLPVQVASVDHGLRAEAAGEAQMVAKICSDLGFAHETLEWRGWDGRGNVQDQARLARRALLAQWAQRIGGGAVALAHTQDDLAETYLMRLARGAGVDGLSAMQPRFVADGTVFLRPLLHHSRDDLRHYLRARGAIWIDDPSNAQTRFARVRARQALPVLEKLGLRAKVIADVAHHLREARAALDYACDDLAGRVLRENCGIVSLDDAWRQAPAELQRRLLQRVIMWIAPQDYPPRGAALNGAIARLSMGRATQLAGCHFLPQPSGVLAFREGRRALGPCRADGLWDGVWRVNSRLPVEAGRMATVQIGPLGAAGLAQWDDWRGLGLPRAAFIAQPSLWQGPRLLATPLHPNLSEKFTFFRRPAADSLFYGRLAD